MIETIYSEENHKYLLMDRVYECNQTRTLATEHGFLSVVPTKKKRKQPWDYNKELYKRCNEVELYFLKLKCFRKFFTYYD